MYGEHSQSGLLHSVGVVPRAGTKFPKAGKKFPQLGTNIPDFGTNVSGLTKSSCRKQLIRLFYIHYVHFKYAVCTQ